jgi:hypothetical protein
MRFSPHLPLHVLTLAQGVVFASLVTIWLNNVTQFHFLVFRRFFYKKVGLLV